MIRGTTPTLTLTVGDSSIDLSTADAVYVTVTRGGEIVTKTGADVSVTGNVVECWLTEEESLKLSDGPANIQVNWTFDGDKRAATKVASINIGKQLLLEEITT